MRESLAGREKSEMGRQIQLFLKPADENLLEGHLRGLANLRILKPFGSSPADLEVASLAAAGTESMLLLWFTDFVWTPEYKRTSTVDAWSYVANKHVAPILEYSRVGRSPSPGRLHWGDRSSGEPGYDRIAFGRFVDRVWRWVRKTAQRHPPDDTWSFPDAARVMGPIYSALESFRAATGATGVWVTGVVGFPRAFVGAASQRGNASREFALLPRGKVIVWLASETRASAVHEMWPQLEERLVALLPRTTASDPLQEAT